MIKRLKQVGLACLIAFAAADARAEVDVAATIAPVHSLAAMVMSGVNAPALIIRPGASPHGYAMKPSEARALDRADVVFWVGETLEPWMTKAIETLASDALVVELGAAEGVHRLGVREGGVWASDGHGHDDADDGHDDHAGHDDDHAGLDPHLWLDPDNAIAWLQAMAAALATVDPEHGEQYQTNADSASERLRAMVLAIETDLAAVRTTPYIVFHDAYQYFERRFALNAVGSISLSDADQPGAGRLVELRKAIRERGAVCAFAEPQFEPKLLDTVIEGSPVKKGVLDPIGADLEPGIDLYPLLMERLAMSLADCLS